MSDKKNTPAAEADDFGDELSDEALDRINRSEGCGQSPSSNGNCFCMMSGCKEAKQ